MKDYLAWVATGPRLDPPTEACAWKHDDFAPDAACLGSGAIDVPCTLDAPPGCDAGDARCSIKDVPPCRDSGLPVVCVDWCDAFAYCASHGKRLCGSLRGGPTPRSLRTNAGESQWMNACSAGGQFDYASGNGPPQGCTYGAARLYPVTEDHRCHSPSPGYSQFQDMSGNAAEWEDSCDSVNTSTPGKDDACAVRGGSHLSPPWGIACGAVETMPRRVTRYDVGFRCCGIVPTD